MHSEIQLSEIQLSEIRNYLLSRDLPLNLMMEIYDHFVEQILSLQNKQHLQFTEAFDKVKILWQKELSFVPSNNLSGKKKTFIDREMDKKILKRISLFSIVFIIFISLLIFLAGKFLSKDTFEILFFVTLITVVLSPSMLAIAQRKELSLKKKVGGLILNNCQDGIKITFSLIPLLLIFFFTNFSTNTHNIYRLIFFEFSKGGLATLMMFELVSFVFFFGLLMHFNFIKELKKTEPFLKYFKTT